MRIGRVWRVAGRNRVWRVTRANDTIISMLAHTAKDIRAIAAQYLKENLQIRLEAESSNGTLCIIVRILLEGDVVSSVTANIPLKQESISKK